MWKSIDYIQIIQLEAPRHPVGAKSNLSSYDCIFASMLNVWLQEAQRMQIRHVTEFGDILMQYGFTAH